MHVHLREPGQEHKETVATGTRVGGGRRLHRRRLHAEHRRRSTTTPASREFILQKAARGGPGARLSDRRRVARVRRASSWPRSRELREAGCVAVSDDGLPVATALLMRRALEYAEHVRHADHRALRGPDAEGRRRGARGRRRRRARPARHSRAWPRRDGRARHPAGRDDRRPRAHRAPERRGPRSSAVRAGQEPRRRGDLRGDAAPLRADRRVLAAPVLRHQHEDEPAAARGRAIATRCSRARRRHAST